jgi:hypothetical protein
LIIVCVLFAGMHVIAWVLARLDARDFRRLSALAHSPALGCTHVADASGETLWTWRFVQDELVLNTKYVGRVSGSAVECAGLIGLPFARLACAIPDTMFGAQPTSHCIGRTGGLCPSRLARMSTKLRSRARSLEEEGAPPLRAAHLADDEAPAGAPAAAADDVHAPPDLVTIASTALMHAVLVSWCLASRHACRHRSVCARLLPCWHADAHPDGLPARTATTLWCSSAGSSPTFSATQRTWGGRRTSFCASTPSSRRCSSAARCAAPRTGCPRLACAFVCGCAKRLLHERVLPSCG